MAAYNLNSASFVSVTFSLTFIFTRSNSRQDAALDNISEAFSSMRLIWSPLPPEDRIMLCVTAWAASVVASSSEET